MKTKLRLANSIAGVFVSVYANSDLGKPLRLRSASFGEFFVRFYHLTHIGLLLTTLTFACTLLLRQLEKSEPRWIHINEFYIHLLVLTSSAECFIPLTFWVLWAIDKENVVRKEDYVGEDSISFFFNFCMHGMPSLFLLVEFFLSEFKYHHRHYLMLFIFFLFYLGIMGLFYLNTGIWPYKIMANLGPLLKVLFLIQCFIVLCAIYTLLSATHVRINRPRRLKAITKGDKPAPKKRKPKSKK